MIKGAQRKMIVMKTAESNLFEEAYFVMRRGVDCNEIDMVAEANSIIENCGCKKKSNKAVAVRFSLKSIAVFLGGSVFGGSIIGAFLYWL